MGITEILSDPSNLVTAPVKLASDVFGGDSGATKGKGSGGATPEPRLTKAERKTQREDALIDKYLKPVDGDIDLKHVDRDLKLAVAKTGRDIGQAISVESGARSPKHQAELYEAYQNGTGNLAAAPCESNHQAGRALDVYAGSTGLRDAAGSAAAKHGVTFPVSGESWHAEFASKPSTVSPSDVCPKGVSTTDKQWERAITKLNRN